MTVLQPGEKWEVRCPECGGEYTAIGHHWMGKSCDRPDLTDRQRELVKGLVMGDGHLTGAVGAGNSCLVVTSTTPQFLEWLNDEFGVLSAGVRLRADSEQLALNAANCPLDSITIDGQYKDLYALTLRAHPTFTEMKRRWYPDGSIRFPDGLSLTPESALTWFCSDGGLHWGESGNPEIRITTANEAGRCEFIKGLFEEHGFTASYRGKDIMLSSFDTRSFLTWIDGPVPGFEYKFAADSREEYDRLKRQCEAEKESTMYTPGKCWRPSETP